MRVELDAREHGVLLAELQEATAGIGEAIESVGRPWNEHDLANSPGLARLVEARDRLTEAPVLDAPRHDLLELLLALRRGAVFWLSESSRPSQDEAQAERLRDLLPVVDAVLDRVRAEPEPPTSHPPNHPRRRG